MVPTSPQIWRISLQGSPSIPRGLEREQGEAVIRRKVLGGMVYFYSWLKNSSNFSKFRSLRPGGVGPGGEAAARGACSVLRVETPLPTRVCVGVQTLSAGPGTEPRARIKRNENEHSKIFFVSFLFLFCVLRGRRKGYEKGKIN